MKGIQQDYLVGIFLNGLKAEIKAEVKLYEPSNLAELMLKAQMVEYKIRVSSKEGTINATKVNSGYKPYSVTRTFFRDMGGSRGSTELNKGKGETIETTSTVGSISTSKGRSFSKAI